MPSASAAVLRSRETTASWPSRVASLMVASFMRLASSMAIVTEYQTMNRRAASYRADAGCSTRRLPRLAGGWRWQGRKGRILEPTACRKRAEVEGRTRKGGSSGKSSERKCNGGRAQWTGERHRDIETDTRHQPCHCGGGVVRGMASAQLLRRQVHEGARLPDHADQPEVSRRSWARPAIHRSRRCRRNWPRASASSIASGARQTSCRSPKTRWRSARRCCGSRSA